jgi:hypothetical protein
LRAHPGADTSVVPISFRAQAHLYDLRVNCKRLLGLSCRRGAWTLSARVSVGSREILLDERWTEMHVQLNQGLMADGPKAMHFTCFDNENIAGTSFELLSIDVPEPTP